MSNEDGEQGLLTEDSSKKTEEPEAAPDYPDPSPFPKRVFGTCRICVKSKHNPLCCDYLKLVPKGQSVGDACEIVCRNCGSAFVGGCCPLCDLDEGRAIVKKCYVCWKSGHWSDTCPQVDKSSEVKNRFEPPIDYWDFIPGSS